MGTTSSQIQNVLASKYEATLDHFYDPRKSHFSKLLTAKSSRYQSNSQGRDTEERALAFNEPSMNSTFNSVTTKFIGIVSRIILFSKTKGKAIDENRRKASY